LPIELGSDFLRYSDSFGFSVSTKIRNNIGFRNIQGIDLPRSNANPAGLNSPPRLCNALKKATKHVLF
jgi:hypothetical protein